MAGRIRSIVSTFGWWQWLLTAVFVLALVVSGLFAVRATQKAIYWRLHQDEPIERWMTINYIAHSYDVPPWVLWQALGIPEPPPTDRRDRRPLGDIASARGVSFDQTKATLLKAIVDVRPPNPPPGPPPAPAKGTPPPNSGPSDRPAP